MKNIESALGHSPRQWCDGLCCFVHGFFDKRQWCVVREVVAGGSAGILCAGGVPSVLFAVVSGRLVAGVVWDRSVARVQFGRFVAWKSGLPRGCAVCRRKGRPPSGSTWCAQGLLRCHVEVCLFASLSPVPTWSGCDMWWRWWWWVCRCELGGGAVGRSTALSGRSERRVFVVGAVSRVVWSWCCVCGGIVLLRIVLVRGVAGGACGWNGCGAHVWFGCRV